MSHFSTATYCGCDDSCTVVMRSFLGSGVLPRSIHSCQSTSSDRHSNGKILFQSVFMLTTVHPFAFASSSALSRRPIDDLRS